MQTKGVVRCRKPREAKARHTKEMISHPRELDAAFEFRVSVHLAAHRLEARRLVVHGDFFRAWMYANDARGETFLEFLCERGRYRFRRVEDDFWEETVGCGGCASESVRK